jgi:hypothetical protein
MKKQEFKAFGQIQMIANVCIAVIGIHIALIAINNYILLPRTMFCRSEIMSRLFDMFYVAVSLGVLSAIVFFMIVNNNWLIKKILPDEEPIPAENQKKWFISSLRIGLVFCGLMLLAGSAESLVYTAKIIAGLPIWGRKLFADIFYDGRFDWPQFFRLFFNIFRVAVIIYLIAGAPGFVKWQTKRTFKQGVENE